MKKLTGCTVSAPVMKEGSELGAGFEDLDGHAVAIYLEVPGSKVVLFQAYMDLSEDIGFVRTIDIRRSRVCVVTTHDMLPECLRLLDVLKTTIGWRYVEKPPDSEKIFGYAKKVRSSE